MPAAVPAEVSTSPVVDVKHGRVHANPRVAPLEQLRLAPVRRDLAGVEQARAGERIETDAHDVAVAVASGDPGFVLLDARSPEAYEAGHLPGALILPRPYSAEDVAGLSDGLVVVYCWGPGCNGATKAAGRLAELGRTVKEMLGGFEYWIREGHPVEGTAADDLRAAADDQGLVRLPHAVSCLC